MLPATVVPELLPRLVVSIQENIALENPQCCQGCKARFDHLPPQTTASMLGHHGQMMQIATPSIVTAKHGTDQSWAISGNQAEARILIQEGPKVIWGVGFVQPHAIRVLHKASTSSRSAAVIGENVMSINSPSKT